MASISLIFLIAIGVVIILWYVEYFRRNRTIRKFNSPFFVPILGHMYRFYEPTEIHSYCKKWLDECGPVVKIWQGLRVFIITSDTKLIEKILKSTDHMEKSQPYEFLRPWLGYGIIDGVGERWRKQRKLVALTFHPKILVRFLDVFDAQGDILVEKLKDKVGKGFFDVTKYIVHCSLDVICETTMGYKVNAQDHCNLEYLHSLETFIRNVRERSLTVKGLYDFVYRFTKSYKEDKEALQILHNFTNGIVSKTKANLNKENLTETDDSIDGIKRSITLNHLLNVKENGRPLPDEDIRGIVDSIVFAGHDTSSFALNTAIYLLSQNLDVQEKVVDELRLIFRGDKFRTATNADLQDMKYMEMVIKECLRVYTPASMIGRKLTSNVEHDGAVIEKGTTVWILLSFIHKNPEIYPDPERFDPERFNAENSNKRGPYDFIPFSAGVRNCVGQRFAMFEMKVILAKLLRSYKILPKPGFKPILEAAMVMRPSNGIWIELEERAF